MKATAVILQVSDLARSTRFYGDGVGLVELHAGSDNGMPGDRWLDGAHQAMTFAGNGDIHFAIYERPDEPTRAMQIGFSVANLDEAHQRMLDIGATVLHPPRKEPWGMVARYEDPDGNYISLG